MADRAMSEGLEYQQNPGRAIMGPPASCRHLGRTASSRRFGLQFQGGRTKVTSSLFRLRIWNGLTRSIRPFMSLFLGTRRE